MKPRRQGSGWGRRRFVAALAGSAGGALLAVRPSGAHPYHTTDAEAELAYATHTVQISLRATPEDLEEALRQATGKRRPLEDVEDQVIIDYLRAHLKLRHDGGAAMPLRWIGKELSTAEAWLHFDYRLPSSARRLTIEHRVFFELEAQQLNTLRFKQGDQQTTLTFHRKAPSASLELAPRPPRTS